MYWGSHKGIEHRTPSKTKGGNLKLDQDWKGQSLSRMRLTPPLTSWAKQVFWASEQKHKLNWKVHTTADPTPIASVDCSILVYLLNDLPEAEIFFVLFTCACFTCRYLCIVWKEAEGDKSNPQKHQLWHWWLVQLRWWACWFECISVRLSS